MSMQQKLADAMTTRYSSGIELWQQQTKCVTDGLVVEDTESGVENKSEDFLGITSMRRKETRDTELTKSELNFRRRWVFSDPYFNMVAVDTADKLRMRVDPATGIAQAQVAAAMRTKDQILIAAAIGTAYTGKTFSTPVSLPGGGTIPDGNLGFTIGKFEDAVEYLKRYGQMESGDRINCLWTSAEEKTFGKQLEVGSADYTSIRFRDKGEIDTYGLVDFRRLEDVYDEDGNLAERMLPFGAGTGTGGANTRTSLMFVKKAIRRWTPKQPTGYVWFNGSKDQYEINTSLDCGAARRMERGVVAVTCITTAP